jgi:hypothetical protein
MNFIGIDSAISEMKVEKTHLTMVVSCTHSDIPLGISVISHKDFMALLQEIM